MLSFKPSFSFSSFTFKRLFSSSLSAKRVVLSVYLRLLIFLPAILIPACELIQPSISHNVLCIWKAITNLDSVLKSRDITLPTKGHISKAMVFPVFTYCCERWTIKKAECQRIDAFNLWCWRILLKVPWPTGRSNQSILREISPEYSLEGLMLKLQYFGHLM